MAFTRYAVYYTPPPGALARFGAAWLGWDHSAGHTAHPDIAGLPLPISEITQTPRRYGFHATIKPPFRLAEGAHVAQLLAAFEALCAGVQPAEVPALELAQLGRFLALVPVGGAAEPNALAAQAVRDLDPFRAPLNDAETARRRGNGLSEDQETRLQKWGYPHVMEGFKFHMTLTSKLPKAQASKVAGALSPVLMPLVPRPFPIEALTLMGEDAEGRFHMITRQPLGRAA